MARTIGSERANCDVSHKGRCPTLRVTVLEEPQRIVLRLEGKLIGPWVTECRRAWLGLETALVTKRLALDLCDVTFVDDSGVALLHDIYRANRAEMLTGSPLTKHFAEKAAASITDRGKEDS